MKQILSGNNSEKNYLTLQVKTILNLDSNTGPLLMSMETDT